MSTNSKQSATSVRRGPTLRGGRYRPGIGRSVRVPQPRRSSSHNIDEEETVGLTAAAGASSTSYEEENEKTEYEFEDLDMKSKRLSEKLETDENGKPIYQHGEETFGDILTHPVEELHAHQNRKDNFQSKVGRWSLLGRNKGASTSAALPVQEETVEYTIVLHFRQLRGNQEFGLNHDSAVDFCKRLKFTQNETLRFNGIHDTDGLTEFLYKIKRDFSIKIHHKSEYIRTSTLEQHIETHHHHNPEHHTIQFNDNLYIEFKPKYNHHMADLPVEATRRYFFQHPEPDLSADIGVETAASWLELFYDLFFVATVTVFTHAHHISDWESLALYTQWFVITWWSWCASSLYTSRFDTDDVMHHIYKFIEMCALIGMAGSSDYFLNSSGYVYGYIALKAVLVIEYSVVFIVAVLAKSKSRIPFAFYVGANLLSIALWASSLSILEKSTHRILWYLGVLSEVLVNVIVRDDKSLSWAAGHLAERLGLLSLIVLGENLMGLVSQVSEAGNSLIIVIPNFMAVLVIFGFFFMYFEDFNKEIFLHNKYHQVWVYLHFPLHLCQVAFGIALIDILKFYKYQLIRDHRLADDLEESATSSATSEGHAGGEGTSKSPDTTSEHETGSTSTSTGAEEAHKVAKRAIMMVNEEYSSAKENDYNPMDITSSIKESYLITSDKQRQISNQQNHWTSWCGYIATSIMTATLALSAPNQEINSTSSSDNHHLMRRAEPEEGKPFTETMTKFELVFVYKTFLIFGGSILVINSLIKALNTKLSDIYGKIIIVSRIINAIILWSMCALPFAKLDAIVLLCTMVGSVVFQGMVDLLD
ncbi:bacterial low temperature requirement A protein-domain-containing protein [Helicostylum pulchrum]|nr:bacterial low temperature requirement A protein-domain-containing protein [Helicostylum pulchrum]